MSTFAGLYNIRGYRPEDKNFIYSTFLNGVYYGNNWLNQINKDIFMANYHKLLTDMLTSGKAQVKVACDKEDPDIIIGYSILSADETSIVWVYVKEKWRKHGIGRSLVPAHPISVANLTELGKKLLDKFELKPTFNPFSL